MNRTLSSLFSVLFFGFCHSTVFAADAIPWDCTDILKKRGCQKCAMIHVSDMFYFPVCIDQVSSNKCSDESSTGGIRKSDSQSNSSVEDPASMNDSAVQDATEDPMNPSKDDTYSGQQGVSDTTDSVKEEHYTGLSDGFDSMDNLKEDDHLNQFHSEDYRPH